MAGMQPRQGEVWQVQLVGKNRPEDRNNPHHLRPVVIVTTDLYNEYDLAYLVAPILPWSQKRAELPTNLVLEPGVGGVSDRSVIFTTQIRTIATWRLVSKSGSLSGIDIDALKDTLRVTFDLF
jgi:mRNA-degrading endonuclease toxin of MazEF toxin-antitoxin module